MPLSTSETNQKETPKEARLLSPAASASANLVIYNSLVININLKPKQPKPETSEGKQDTKPAP